MLYVLLHSFPPSLPSDGFSFQSILPPDAVPTLTLSSSHSASPPLRTRATPLVLSSTEASAVRRFLLPPHLLEQFIDSFLLALLSGGGNSISSAGSLVAASHCGWPCVRRSSPFSHSVFFFEADQSPSHRTTTRLRPAVPTSTPTSTSSSNLLTCLLDSVLSLFTSFHLSPHVLFSTVFAACDLCHLTISSSSPSLSFIESYAF
jgi:hypothetical protein